MAKTKEEILVPHITKRPVLVHYRDAKNAMQEYADQCTSQLREELEAAKKEIEKLKGDNDKLSAEVYGMFKIIGKALAKGTGHQTVPDKIIIRFIK